MEEEIPVVYKYKLSIITVNLNNRNGLQKTIESVISQTFHNFEWIIIDGGSTDGSKELIEKYTDHINFWVSEPDKGIYNAMNKGIRKSNGEYLLFLNSGDFLYNTEVISQAIKLLKDRDYYIGNEIRPNGIFNVKMDSEYEIIKNLIENYFPHQSTFIKKNIFIKYGLYREDKKIVSDWEKYYKSIILGNVTIQKIPLIISVFNEEGYSFKNIPLALKERKEILEETPYILTISRFYIKYFNIIEKLKKYHLLKKLYLRFFFKN